LKLLCCCEFSLPPLSLINSFIIRSCLPQNTRITHFSIMALFWVGNTVLPWRIFAFYPRFFSALSPGRRRLLLWLPILLFIPPSSNLLEGGSLFIFKIFLLLSIVSNFPFFFFFSSPPLHHFNFLPVSSMVVLPHRPYSPPLLILGIKFFTRTLLSVRPIIGVPMAALAVFSFSVVQRPFCVPFKLFSREYPPSSLVSWFLFLT